MNYKLFLPLVLILSAFPASAEERWFEVELLLFQRNVAIQDVAEDLSSENITLNTANSINLLKAKGNNLCVNEQPCLIEPNKVLIDSIEFDSLNNALQLLDADKLQLSTQREKLQAHASFTPVLHLGWRMPVESASQAKPIYLFAGENFTAHNQQNSDENIKSAAQPLDNKLQANELLNTAPIKDANITVDKGEANLVQAMPVAEKWALDGNIKIYLDHYLYIDSQLVIRQQTTQDVKVSEDAPSPTFEVIASENDVQVIKQIEIEKPVEIAQETVISEVLFSQNRRLRSEEIHYFDHPLMGMILQIRKFPDEQLAELQEEPLLTAPESEIEEDEQPTEQEEDPLETIN